MCGHKFLFLQTSTNPKGPLHERDELLTATVCKFGLLTKKGFFDL
jgi:hypothetical protein